MLVTAKGCCMSEVFPSIEGPPDYLRHNKGIRARFFTRADPIVDTAGKPVLDVTGKPKEYVIELCTITIIGDPFSEITCLTVDSTEMSPHLRFQAEYEAWKSGKDVQLVTRLEDWNEGGMNERFIRNLNSLNIHTVEDLANVSDVHVTRIMHGRDLRNKAINWLKAHSSRREDDQVAQLRAQNEALMKRLDAALAALDKATAAKKPTSEAQLQHMARMREARGAKAKSVSINTAELPNA
jgi:hypothetical protein